VYQVHSVLITSAV